MITQEMPPHTGDQAHQRGERLAKRLARLGIASRRRAEDLIRQRRITVNGQCVDTPAFLVCSEDVLTLDGVLVRQEEEQTRLWCYHKPKGLVTTHHDPEGRPTVFDHLPDFLPRVISVGRLDLTSEGLLLLTNDGALSRRLEHPKTGLKRVYRVKVFGHVGPEDLKRLAVGMHIDGIHYAPIQGVITRQTASHTWVELQLTEGKNREIRRVMGALGYPVTRLIRVAYGPFTLGDLAPGHVIEVTTEPLAPFLTNQ